VPPPIAVCIGSSAEALRLAPVVHELRRRDAPHVVVAAGRPSRMLDDMLATFAISPEIDLRPDARGDAATALGAALAFARPAAVVLAGGTATTLSASPAAFSRGIPVAHVGGGAGAARLACEGERRLLAHLATWHFAPDEAGRAALLADGVEPASIEVTGSLVAEAARGIAERDGLVAQHRTLAGPRRVLVALRRGAGRDDADRAAGATLAGLAERADVEVAIAAPRSPLLRDAVAAHDNVRLLGCPRYASFVAALAASHLLLSDAADALEAAAALDVPTVAVGDPAVARREAERALDDDALHRPLRLVPAAAREDGAAARIVARVAGGRSAVVADAHSATLAA